MAKAFLKKVLGRPGADRDRVKPFTLPGALFNEVRVLLFDSGDPTDLLFAMPLLVEIRDRFPDAVFGLVSDERTGHLALSSGQFQELIVVESEQLRARGKAFELLESAVSAEDWDIAILLSRTPDSAREKLVLASGAHLRLGPGHPAGYPQINCAVRSTANGHYPYRRTATWGKLFGLPLEHAPLSWPLSEDRVRQMAQLVHFNKPRKDQLLIGVDPGLGKEGTVFSADNLAFLINHLASHVQSKTIVLSADTDAERVSAFTSLLRADQLDLPRPTLQETILLLNECDLFVAGNTDLFHYAVALGVPALGMFTPSDRERWIPDESDDIEILACEEGARLDLSELMARVDQLLD